MKAQPCSALQVAQAYDSIAADYDAQVEAGAWMRRILWERYTVLFKAGQRILDLSCGTGIDSIFLAQRGLHVTAVDVSPGMVAQLRQKACRLGLSEAVEVLVRDIGAIDEWPAEDAPFDGAISAFAGLSTLPDLTALGAALSARLKPSAHVLVHMLNRHDLWKTVERLRRKGWRRDDRSACADTMLVSIGGVTLPHYLHTPMDAYRRYFAASFRLCRVYGMGVLRPPRIPHWLRGPGLATLTRLDRYAAAPYPLSGWGTFFVLEMQKR